jgi:hypothetical protein
VQTLTGNMNYHYTQLYVDGLPVDYNIIIKQVDEFIFEPGYNPHHDLEAPFFIVRKENDEFYFERLEDDSLRHQAEEELREYLSKTNNPEN